jgi:hypothetical protein
MLSLDVFGACKCMKGWMPRSLEYWPKTGWNHGPQTQLKKEVKTGVGCSRHDWLFTYYPFHPNNMLILSGKLSLKKETNQKISLPSMQLRVGSHLICFWLRKQRQQILGVASKKVLLEKSQCGGLCPSPRKAHWNETDDSLWGDEVCLAGQHIWKGFVKKNPFST